MWIIDHWLLLLFLLLFLCRDEWMDGWMDGAILNIKDFLCGGKEVVTVNTEVLSQSLVSRETSISLAFFPNISL